VEQVPETVTRGLMTLKLIPGETYVSGGDLLLAPKDYALLLYFVQNENRVMSAEQLYKAAWGQPMAGDSQALRKAVTRLRQKLAGCGYHISAEYGTGYCFQCGDG
jgi:DNA-binding response OmpR family regulator